MKGWLRLSRGIDTLMEWVGGLSMLLVTLLLGVGIYNVVVRYIGRLTRQNLASNTLLEAQWYLFSVIFFLGFAFILKRNTHVRVDFLYQNFGPKTRAWVNLFGTLVFLLPFCVLGIYVTYEPVLRSWGLRPNGTWGAWELSPDAGGLPRAPLRAPPAAPALMPRATGCARAWLPATASASPACTKRAGSPDACAHQKALSRGGLCGCTTQGDKGDVA